MKKFILTISMILISSQVMAATVDLKSGKRIEGDVIEKTDRYIKIDTGEKVWQIQFRMMDEESVGTLSELDNFLEKKKPLEPVVEEAPESPVPTPTPATSFSDEEQNQQQFIDSLNQGVDLYLNNQFEAAKASFEKTVELYPNEGLAYYYLANVYGNLGEIAISIKNYNMAMKLNVLSQIDPAVGDHLGELLGPLLETTEHNINYESVDPDFKGRVTIKVSGNHGMDEEVIRDVLGSLEKQEIMARRSLFSEVTAEFIRVKEEGTLIQQKWTVNGSQGSNVYWVTFDLTPPPDWPYKMMIKVSNYADGEGEGPVIEIRDELGDNRKFALSANRASNNEVSQLQDIVDRSFKLARAKSYGPAEIEAKKALEMAKKIYTQEIDHASYYNLLASIYADQSKFEEALPLYEKDYEILKKHLGENDPETARAMNYLAFVYREAKLYRKAEDLLKEQLVIVERETGKVSYETSTTLRNLAALYVDEGDVSKAEPIWERLIEMYKERFGEDHEAMKELLQEISDLKEGKLGK